MNAILISNKNCNFGIKIKKQPSTVFFTLHLYWLFCGGSEGHKPSIRFSPLINHEFLLRLAAINFGQIDSKRVTQNPHIVFEMESFFASLETTRKCDPWDLNIYEAAMWFRVILACVFWFCWMIGPRNLNI